MAKIAKALYLSSTILDYIVVEELVCYFSGITSDGRFDLQLL